MTAVLLLVAGIALLVVGGEVLVRGASTIARSFGLSPLVVGLTVVSFATSAPELAVTVEATLSGSPGLAVGNVVGSNVANILLVVGVAGTIMSLHVQSSVLRRDVPVLIALSLLFWVMALDGTASTVDGLMLLGLLLTYTTVTVVRSRQGKDPGPVEDAPTAPGGVPVAVLLVAAGVGLLVFGASWLVSGAVDIATALGLSETVVGLTIVAIGTSLPELTTSVTAALRGSVEMAVGNAVGSCIFNLGAVMGLTAVISPSGVPVTDGALTFDVPVMVAVVVSLLPVVFTGRRVAKREAWLFVGYYTAYTAYLLLDSTGHDALPQFSSVMLAFVIPMTVVTLGLLVIQEIRVRRSRRAPDRTLTVIRHCLALRLLALWRRRHPGPFPRSARELVRPSLAISKGRAVRNVCSRVVSGSAGASSAEVREAPRGRGRAARGGDAKVLCSGLAEWTKPQVRGTFCQCSVLGFTHEQ